ncbi:GNAT family N-acetyltransferase [Puniceibacterium sediminis]|uniref:Acetyltransferase (GNAT) family protein n=1 Tax=Puniceibacterium sediminis TaxID=1608407 RepID=A0A238WRP9_9RHOB|nr:GNAT family N-acetyltransferase [Puniceibacterium sediminis]SNR49226.1 Acetyltransferase (GNAT) family protein [Puniceibacterium sediminis]
MIPDLDFLYAVTEATWPPASRTGYGPVTLRDGAGGGKRVSAATADGNWIEGDLASAEAAMEARGQTPLFMIRAGEGALDTALAARGYEIIDPVNVWLCPLEQLTDKPIPRVTAFAIWEPLAIMREIWAKGGIGPERIAVMERAQTPKTGLFGRENDKPAGTGYCALHKGIAMVHALEILPAHRGKGLGKWMMRCAAFWAQANGGTHMAVLCTKTNAGANGLYASLGMAVVGQYHYRIKPEDPAT